MAVSWIKVYLLLDSVRTIDILLNRNRTHQTLSPAHEDHIQLSDYQILSKIKERIINFQEKAREKIQER